MVGWPFGVFDDVVLAVDLAVPARAEGDGSLGVLGWVAVDCDGGRVVRERADQLRLDVEIVLADVLDVFVLFVFSGYEVY